MAAPDDLVPSALVKVMCGQISDMTLFRWTRDLGFPEPDVVIQRRKFWRHSTVQAWLAARPAASTTKPPRPKRQKTEAADGQTP